MVALVVPLPFAFCRLFFLLVVCIGIGGTGSRGLDELGENGGRPFGEVGVWTGFPRMCVGF